MILINGKEVHIQHYPNKELLLGEELVHFVSSNRNEIQSITLRFEDNADFLALLFINSWMNEEGYTKQRLLLPYMPYSRMDRKVARHLFSLSYISQFINAMAFEEVVVLEAHSVVTLELLERVRGISYTKQLMAFAMDDMQFDTTVDAVVFPDKGARKRYANLLPTSLRIIEGEKTRDFDSGEVLKLELIGDVAEPLRNVLIVDDLCSRGSTFIQITEACRKVGIEKSYMTVTHLEHNVYSGRVFDEVTKIYTTDALQPFLSRASVHDKISILPLPKGWQMT